MAPDVPGRTPIGPLAKDPALDPERLERCDLLGLCREPRQVGMIEDVVECQQPTHQHIPGRDPAPPIEVLGSERPVDLAGPDPARGADAVDAGRGILDGQALRDESAERRVAPSPGGNPGNSSTARG